MSERYVGVACQGYVGGCVGSVRQSGVPGVCRSCMSEACCADQVPGTHSQPSAPQARNQATMLCITQMTQLDRGTQGEGYIGRICRKGRRHIRVKLGPRAEMVPELCRMYVRSMSDRGTQGEGCVGRVGGTAGSHWDLERKMVSKVCRMYVRSMSDKGTQGPAAVRKKSCRTSLPLAKGVKRAADLAISQA